MKIVCVEPEWSQVLPVLEKGKVYEGTLVFYDITYSKNINDRDNPVEWNKNYFTIEGFDKVNWFPTSMFMTIDMWREQKLNDSMVSILLFR